MSRDKTGRVGKLVNRTDNCRNWAGWLCGGLGVHSVVESGCHGLTLRHNRGRNSGHDLGGHGSGLGLLLSLCGLGVAPCPCTLGPLMIGHLGRSSQGGVTEGCVPENKAGVCLAEGEAWPSHPPQEPDPDLAPSHL